MSSSEQHAQGLDYPASSSEARRDAQAKQQGPESVSSAGEHMNQQTDSTVETVASQALQPPARPERPKTPVSSPPVGDSQKKESGATMSEGSNLSETTVSHESDALRPLPIPPASEPMQYRAIGLIRGKYMPSEDQFTRGNLLTDDGTEVDAVLLGRVMSLVKKHIELDEPHLWVVYPRTRNKDSQLHAQIVGVWEPERLNRDDDDFDEADEADESEPSDLELSGSELPDSELSEIDADTEHPDTSETAETESAPSEAKVVASDSSAEAIATESASSAEDPAEDSAKPEEAIGSPEVEEAEAKEAEVGEAEVEATAETAETDQAVSTSETPESAEATEAPAATSRKSASSDLLPAPQPPKAPAAPSAAPALATNPDGSPEMLDDGYFSIRGEIVKYSPGDGELTVKIRQAPRKAGSQAKAFNLILLGELEGRTTGYFWELDVQRQGNNLVVQNGSMVRMVPPSKGKRKGGSFRDGNRRGGSGSYSSNNRPGRAPVPSRPTPKPIRKNAAPPSQPPTEAPSAET
ncbi:MAG: hypothetical protein WBA57_19315 [Elainellaceae cyanobacterium]